MKEFKNKLDKVIFVYDFCEDYRDCNSCVLKGKEHNWKKSFLKCDCPDILHSDEEDLDKAIKLIIESKELDKAHNGYKMGTFLDKEFNIPNQPTIPPMPKVNRKDNVNSPSHYTDGKIEVIEYIEDKKLGFCLGNAIKYISRAGKKYKDKEVEDCKKAIWYLKRHIKSIEEVD